MEVFVAPTDQRWFESLSAEAGTGGHVDEVNFWSPSSVRPLRRLEPGSPLFFRLKSPRNCIAGYGFFAHFSVLRLDQAWEWFGTKNGDPDEERFLARIGGYRGRDLLDPAAAREPLGCTILRDARFWPHERWIPWGEEQGWHRNVVRGAIERDPARHSRLLAEIAFDHQATPEEFRTNFEPLDADERAIRLARTRPREGQGTFRARLLDAYGRRCAITGEHTEIVLEAAHIQPYLGPRSNHVQNGLLLTKEFHALFDAGYATVTPDYRVRISPRLRSEWRNGARYYPFDGRALQAPGGHTPGSERRWSGGGGYWREGPIAPDLDFYDALPSVGRRAVERIDAAAADAHETTNRWGAEPERVAALSALLDEIRARGRSRQSGEGRLAA